MLRSALRSPRLRLPSPTTNRGSFVPRAFRSLSRALHDSRRLAVLAAHRQHHLVTAAFTPMAASNAALCRHSTVLHFAGRGLPESPSDSSWIFRRWWRTVCLAYSASGDWPRIPGCDPYPACAIPDATARSHRGQRQGGADSPRAGVGGASESSGIAVSRAARFGCAADPRVCRRRPGACGGGNGVPYEPGREVLGGVNP